MVGLMKSYKPKYQTWGSAILAVMLMLSVVFAFSGNTVRYSAKSEKTSKSKTEQTIKASCELKAVIQTLNVQFNAIQVEFLKPFEAIELPLLFTFEHASFENTYFTNLLTYFISPRAP